MIKADGGSLRIWQPLFLGYRCRPFHQKYAGAAVGAAVGALASMVGALAGFNVDSWADRAAGKGWQVGTLIAGAAMLPSELVRQVALPVMSTSLYIVARLMGHLGSLVKQSIDILTTTPLYTTMTPDSGANWV